MGAKAGVRRFVRSGTSVGSITSRLSRSRSEIMGGRPRIVAATARRVSRRDYTGLINEYFTRTAKDSVTLVSLKA